MTRPVAKLLVGFSIVAALLVVASVIFTLGRPAPAPPRLPQPNGYDDLVQAGRMLADHTSEFDTMSEEELRTLVRENTDALKLARTGLSRACQVPLEYSATNETRRSNLAVLKRLTQALAAEGRLAELENRPADAAESYLSAIQLSGAITQGGLLIDLLVGVAVESIGMAGLEKLALTLDAQQSRKAAAALESWESQRETADALLARERQWARRTYGLKAHFIRLVMFKSVKQTEQRACARLTAQQTRFRRLLIQLAARAYELEKGERPKSLADLVPAYLKAIPQDPVTGTNMAYYP